MSEVTGAPEISLNRPVTTANAWKQKIPPVDISITCNRGDRFDEGTSEWNAGGELRNTFFDAESVLTRLEAVQLDGDVIEFGCGYGLFTQAIARRTVGTVYALDIDPAMISRTRKVVDVAQCRNVITEERDFVSEGCGRPDGMAVYAMLFNILHIEAPVALLREVGRALRGGGKAAIIHWNYDPETPRGPSLDIRPRPEDCRAWLEEAGFRFLRFDPLDCCPHHYGLLGEKPTV